VVLDAEIPSFADEGDVLCGAVGLDVAKKRLKAAIDGGEIEYRLGGGRDGLYRCRWESDGIRFRCRCGLADCRHTSL